MNATTSAPGARIAKPFSARGLVQALLAASMLAIGAGAGAAINAASSDEAAPVTRTRIIEVAPIPPHTNLFYLVGSEEQRELVLWGESEAANERANANIQEPDQTVKVLLVETPEQEQAVMEQIGAAAAAGAQSKSVVSVLDLR
jgi:hypothetical protein